MKLERLRSLGLLPTLLFLLFATTSCLDEKYEVGSGSSAEKMVTFSLTLPGQVAGGATYALSSSDEDAVNSVELLLFSPTGNYLQTRMVSSGEITPVGNLKRFTVKIPEGTYSSIVVLANSSNLIASAGLTTTDTKASVLARLKLTHSGKWIADSNNGGYKFIPMWSELTSITVDQNTTATTTATPWSLSLTRMLAKVSVTLATQTAQDKLTLQSIRVYNYYNEGLVAPESTKWNSNVATAASLPAGATKPVVTNPYTTLTYSGAEITTPGKASTGEVYLFESDNARQTDLLDHTCLVIGGTYADDGNLHFYRIDFAQNNSGTDVYLDILRNYHYKVSVNDISGPGYPTPDEAFSARPYNIESTVVAWNDAHVNSGEVAGQYALSLSQMTFDFTGDVHVATDTDNRLTILTDYSGGWNITSIVDATSGAPVSWLTLAPDDKSGTANTSKTISLLLEQNNVRTPRSAKILVKAGVITMEVRVNQGLAPPYIFITDLNGKHISELSFPSGLDAIAPIQQKSFRVKWAPKADPVNVTVSQGIGGSQLFSFAASSDQITTSTITNSNGLKQYSILPLAMTAAEIAANPFLEKSSEIKYQVIDGANVAEESIILRQINYTVQATVDPLYFFNHITDNFVVKSNAAWRIKSVTQLATKGTGPLLKLSASDNLRAGTTGGPNQTTGEKLNFTMNSSTAYVVGTVTVVFESTDNPKKFSDVTVTLNVTSEYYPTTHSGWAGSNIYWDGSKLTFDDSSATAPHRTYQGVFFQWGSLTGISPVGNFDENTILYPPGGTTTVAGGTGWTDLVHVSDVTVSSNFDTKTRAYLYELNESTGTGDICKYITEHSPGGLLYGKRWRMATCNEFAGTYSDWIVGSSGGTAADGSRTFTQGRTKTAANTPFFPAGGSRFRENGAMQYTGTTGNSWSASPSGEGRGYDMYFDNTATAVNPAVIYYRTYGFPVRCVSE